MEDYTDRMKKYQTAKNYLGGNTMGATKEVKNPFLNDTINQRQPETPMFDAKITMNQSFGA
jgi:hypothetical protein